MRAKMEFKIVEEAQAMKLVDDLLDLQKQATNERTHYYVGSRASAAAQMIASLMIEVKVLREAVRS